jgi:hypothetical protein
MMNDGIPIQNNELIASPSKVKLARPEPVEDISKLRITPAQAMKWSRGLLSAAMSKKGT